MAVFEDLQQIPALRGGEFSKSPVIQYQDVGSGELFHHLRIAAIPVGIAEFIEQPGEPMVLDGEAVAAGLVAERAADPGLAGAGGAGDEQVEVFSVSIGIEY